MKGIYSPSSRRTAFFKCRKGTYWTKRSFSSSHAEEAGVSDAVDYTPSARGPSPLHKIADFVRINTSSSSAIRRRQALPFSRASYAAHCRVRRGRRKFYPVSRPGFSVLSRTFPHGVLGRRIVIHIVFTRFCCNCSTTFGNRTSPSSRGPSRIVRN